MKINLKTISVTATPNKGLSLIEVLITVAILSSAIAVVLRAFASLLATTQYSQNITRATLLAEDKLWRLENGLPFEDKERGEEKFTPAYTQTPDILPDFKDLELLKVSVSWEEKGASPYTIDFYTYLQKKT
jgi:prepilin-type N-terminal cleavage/methylation domain-containing protein